MLRPVLPDVLSLRFAHWDSHPETGRRAAMCEASVALAIERSNASKTVTVSNKTKRTNDLMK